MFGRIGIRPRARFVALAVGAAAFGALASAPASFAAFGTSPQPPAVGANCQLDGKISGRGSTFQENLINEYAYEYQQDVCGPVGNANSTILQTGFSDPAGTSGDGTPASANEMIAYNYTGDSSTATGSGNGQTAISCRSDMFGGSDLPYFQTVLTELNDPPGQLLLSKTNTSSAGAGQGKVCPAANGSGIIGPYLGPAGGSYPSVSGSSPNQTLNSGPDAAESVMSIPTGGGPIEVGANLPSNVTPGTTAGTAGCTGTAPTTLNLTGSEMDKIWQGTINQWNDSTLTANNSGLTSGGCSGPIVRVVRADNSGSTEILMEYLNNVDSGTLCGSPTSSTWQSLGNFQGTGSNNTTWPSGCQDGNGNVAPNTVVGSTTGTNALLAKLATEAGGIGYGELGDWNGKVGTTTVAAVPGHITASIQTNASLGGTPVYEAPVASNGNVSDCNLGANGLPNSGLSASDAVGLNSSGLNWATDASPNVVDIAASQTTSYPLCGLTFDFVLTHTNDQAGETSPTNSTQAVQGPLQGMTNDQMRTMYSFFSYMLTPAAQVGLNTAGYDQIPAPWLSLLRQGFQNNY